MAWTTPSTISAGDDLTAALWNAQVRDNMKAIGDPWITYAPSWTASSVNPAIGNGQISSAYVNAGKLVGFRVQIVMGSTTTYGTGNWRFNLPFTPAAIVWPFLCEFTDTGVGNFGGRAICLTSGSATIAFVTGATTAGAADRVVSSTVPFTWGNGDILNVSGFYEAA